MAFKPAVFLAITVLFAGCGITYAPFTEDVRATRTLAECVFHLPIDVEFRSIQVLDTVSGEGPFKPDGRRTIHILASDSGKAVSHGEDWITVDFGSGVVLRFQRAGSKNVYITPGWGTITIDGDRYDMRIGVISGTYIQLHWEPLKPPESPA